MLSVGIGLHLSYYVIATTEDYKEWVNDPTQHSSRYYWNRFVEPHPYFGYYNKNNLPVLPAVKSGDEFVIAIAGGSFAEDIGNFLLSESGKPQIEALATIAKGKPVRIINMGLGGYLQPVAFLQFSLYANAVDAFVSIEGHNELNGDNSLCAPRAWPMVFISESSEFKNKPIVIIARSFKKIFTTIDDLKTTGPFTEKINSVLAYAVGKPIRKGLISLEKRAERSLTDSACAIHPPSPNTEERIQIWNYYVSEMQKISRQNKIPLLVIFQPNLHFAGSKILSPQESKWVNQKQQYSSLKSERYQKAKEYFAILKHPDFYDYSDVFKNYSQSLYNDDCCHLNDEGKKIFSDQLVRDIVNKLAP